MHSRKFQKLTKRLNNLGRQYFFHFLPWLILISFLIFTWMAWLSSSANSHKTHKENFDLRVRETLNLIVNRISIYEQVLHGLQGLFNASDYVSRNDFRSYVNSLKLAENYPGIQGVGFSLYIPASALDKHLATVHSEGFPEYSILPAGKRDFYSSILYLEPFSGLNLRAFGYDMYSEPARHLAMTRSRDTENAAISGKVRLVQEYEMQGQPGFLMYLPVFKNSLPHNTLIDRRSNIMGWVYAPFRMHDLMRGIHGDHANEVGIKIFDGNEMNANTLMYDSESQHKLIHLQKNAIVSNKTISIANHQWTVQISDLTNNTQKEIDRPAQIAIIGIIFSMMAAWLTWLLVLARNRAIHLTQLTSLKLNAVEARYRTLIENANDIVFTVSSDGIFTYVSPNWEMILGHRPSDVIGKSFVNYVHPDDIRLCQHTLDNTISGDKPHKDQIQYRVKHKDGTWRWHASSASRFIDPLSHAIEFLGISHDITDRMLLENKLEREAHLDYLTGITNRRYFMELAERELSRAKRHDTPLNILMMDIDLFKVVNDNYGHKSGDIVLQKLSELCQDILRKEDLFGRVGGEEFAILLQNTPLKKAIEVAERLREAVAKSKVILENSSTVNFTVSIGVASLTDKSINLDELLNLSDKALYKAKQSGRNKVCVYP